MQVTLATARDRDCCVDIAESVLKAGREVGEYLDSENCFVGLAQGGFIAVMVNCDSADLLDIAVVPECRKKGTATALMSFMEAECKKRGVREIFLEVRESNTPAISLYLKHGFQKISVRTKYYSEPVEDAVIMRKAL